MKELDKQVNLIDLHNAEHHYKMCTDHLIKAIKELSKVYKTWDNLNVEDFEYDKVKEAESFLRDRLNVIRTMEKTIQNE